jgi:hypothetical protein
MVLVGPPSIQSAAIIGAKVKTPNTAAVSKVQGKVGIMLVLIAGTMPVL